MMKRNRKYTVRVSKRYRRELKAVLLRGKDESKMEEVIDILASGEKLPPRYKAIKIILFQDSGRVTENAT